MEMWKSHSDSGNARFSGVADRIISLFRGRNGTAENKTAAATPQEARGLDAGQFDRVETDSGAAIFVTKVSDSRYFDESPEYTPVIRPIYKDSLDDFEIPEPAAQNRTYYYEPADMFSNARRRPVYEPVDFNEIVVKQPAPAKDAEPEVFSVPAEDAAAEEIPVSGPAPAEETVSEGLFEKEEIPEISAEEAVPVSEGLFEKEEIAAEEIPADDGICIDDIMAELAVAQASAEAFQEAVAKVREAEVSAALASAQASAEALCEAVAEAQEASEAVPETQEIPAKPAILALPQGEPVHMLAAPAPVSAVTDTVVADTVIVREEPVRMSIPKFRYSFEDLEKEAAELEDANSEPEYEFSEPENFAHCQAAMTSEAAAPGIDMTVGFTENNVIRDVAEIVDINRDVLCLYVPTLSNDIDLYISTTADDNSDLPEDGLESYDRKFKIRMKLPQEYYGRPFTGDLRHRW